MDKPVKVFKPFDFRGAAGIMLRGKNVYSGGSSSPNPMGINTKKLAKMKLQMLGKK